MMTLAAVRPVFPCQSGSAISLKRRRGCSALSYTWWCLHRTPTRRWGSGWGGSCRDVSGAVGGGWCSSKRAAVDWSVLLKHLTPCAVSVSTELTPEVKIQGSQAAFLISWPSVCPWIFIRRECSAGFVFLFAFDWVICHIHHHAVWCLKQPCLSPTVVFVLPLQAVHYSTCLSIIELLLSC